MLENIIKAPVNLYFEITPIGRILNKFSKDLNQIEYTKLAFFLVNNEDKCQSGVSSKDHFAFMW